MGHRVKVIPTGQDFEVQSKETLLDAGLRSGLNLPYNCGTGTCGGCRIRILTGEVEQVPYDFRFTEAERAAGWVLPCRAHACSDLEIEARLLETASDVPAQKVVAKVSHVEVLQPAVIQFSVRTPRTQTLQFLAGQRVAVRFSGLPPRELSLASCPCDGLHLRFHVRRGEGGLGVFDLSNRDLILDYLDTHGSIRRAAAAMGIPKSTLADRAKRLGIRLVGRNKYGVAG